MHKEKTELSPEVIEAKRQKAHKWALISLGISIFTAILMIYWEFSREAYDNSWSLLAMLLSIPLSFLFLVPKIGDNGAFRMFHWLVLFTLLFENIVRSLFGYQDSILAGGNALIFFWYVLTLLYFLIRVFAKFWDVLQLIDDLSSDDGI